MKSIQALVFALLLTIGMVGSAAAQVTDTRTPGPGKPGDAVGIVIRPTFADGRFLVKNVQGIFRPDADVSVFDPEGRFVATGNVESIYEDDLYVDVDKSAARAITLGFVVATNVPAGDAHALVARFPKVIQSVKADVVKERLAQYEEDKAEYKEDQRRRDDQRFQYQMRRMELDFVYNNYYYRYWW